MSRSRQVAVVCGAIVGVVMVLFLGGKTYRTDNYRPVSRESHRLPDARCILHLFNSGEAVEETPFLSARQPKDICCMVSVFAFNPAYTSFRVNRLSIDVNGTNRANIESLSPVDAKDLKFKPYIDKEAFRSEFPLQDPREATFSLIPGPKVAQELAFTPTLGSKVQVRLNLDVLSGDTLVCSTNLQADFILHRYENRHSWAEMIFLRFFMPRF